MTSDPQLPSTEGQSSKIVRRKIALLQPHPLQIHIASLTEPELHALAKDMDERGQRQPIELMPDGVTILDGHQRVAAARLLKWSQVNAMIRSDLADATPSAQAIAFWSANLNRRHMHPLDRARLVKSILEAELGRKPAGLRRDEKPELTHRIRELMGLGAKSCERYLRVLDAPEVVQRMFVGKLIKLDHAVKIGVWAATGKEQRVQQIEEALNGLTDARQIRKVIEEHFPSAHGRHQIVGDALDTFVKNCDRAHTDLGNRIDKVSPSLVQPTLPILIKTRAMIDALVQRVVPTATISPKDTVSRQPRVTRQKHFRRHA